MESGRNGAGLAASRSVIMRRNSSSRGSASCQSRSRSFEPSLFIPSRELPKRPCGVVHLETAWNNFLARLLDGHMPRHLRCYSLRFGPANRVINHSLDEWMMVNRITFVARAKIKDPATAAGPAVPAPEDFAAFEPRDEDLLIRRRNAERLTVALGVLQFDKPIDSSRNGMTGVDNPDALAF